MADSQYFWPPREEPKLLGKRISRLDGMAKATGTAKYTYDINLDKQLIARALSCPHAHCRVKSIDTSAAETVPGAVAVMVFDHGKT